jgi:hypothetical protein
MQLPYFRQDPLLICHDIYTDPLCVLATNAEGSLLPRPLYSLWHCLHRVTMPSLLHTHAVRQAPSAPRVYSPVNPQCGDTQISPSRGQASTWPNPSNNPQGSNPPTAAPTPFPPSMIEQAGAAWLDLVPSGSSFTALPCDGQRIHEREEKVRPL